MQTEVVMYEHHCQVCHKHWSDEKKISECPRCGHWHIWRNGTSYLKTFIGKYEHLTGE